MKRVLTIITCLVALTALTTTVFAQIGGGDICASATAITTLPYTDNGSTSLATDDYNEICPYTPLGAPDVVYSYTPAAAGFLDLTLCTGTTAYDTKMYVYTTCPTPGTGTTGTEIACVDDACAAPLYASPWISSIENLAVAGGTTYYIVIDGYDAASLGNYTLNVATAANPPMGDDLAMVAGFLGDLTQVPFSQNTPGTFFAAAENLGANTEIGVTVTMDVLDNGASIASDVSTPAIDILAGAVGTFDGSTPYAFPTDSNNAYVLQFVHSGIPDDSSNNDTIFDFKFVNDSTMAFDLAVFAGVDIFVANISGATATAELACWYIMSATDTLTSVTAFLQPDVTEIGQQVTAHVYEFLDTLPFATSNPQTMDTGQFAWDFEFPGGVELEADSGYLVAVKNGTVAVGLTDILTTGFSSWGRQQSPDDNWGFFAGLDWMIWANFGPVKAVCNPPTGLTANVTGPRTVSLSWNAVPGAQGYELTGGVAGNPGSYVAPISTSNTFFNVINLCINFSYEWTVRTVCDATTKSDYAAPVNVFTTAVCGNPGPASTTVTGSSATLIWNQVNGAIGYQVAGSAQGGSVVTLNVNGGANTSLTVNNLPAANYVWQVKAACALNTPCKTTPTFGTAASSSFTITGPPAKNWNGNMFNSVINADVSIYPNPATDQVTVSFGDVEAMSASSIEVYNVEGKLLNISSVIESNNIQLNTSNLANGVYQIMVKGDNISTTEKLVIAR